MTCRDPGQESCTRDSFLASRNIFSQTFHNVLERLHPSVTEERRDCT